MRGDPRAIEELGNCDSEDDDDDNWMPAPSDADPGTIKPNFLAFNSTITVCLRCLIMDMFITIYSTTLSGKSYSILLV